MSVVVRCGNCVEVLDGMEAESFSAAVTDPPYELNFMNRHWDRTGVAFNPKTWAAVMRVLRPGAYLVAFSGARTYHRMVCAIEDAGFEIHPMLGWVTAAGFPKATSVSRMIDKAAGAAREVVGSNPKWNCAPRAMNPGGGERLAMPAYTAPATEAARQWDGWYYGLQSLKPALEPICLAQKPFSEKTGYENVLRHGTGALNIDSGRVPIDPDERRTVDTRSGTGDRTEGWGTIQIRADGQKFTSHTNGRWPPNLAHDGSPEVMEAFARFGERPGPGGPSKGGSATAWPGGAYQGTIYPGDTGTAARFFKECRFSHEELRFHFGPKAASWERQGGHPTIKPVSLMLWLCQLVCPPGGRLLDCFAGTGSTLVACDWLGIDAVGIEQDPQTCRDAEAKIKRLRARRMLGEVERNEPLPGQLGLF